MALGRWTELVKQYFAMHALHDKKSSGYSPLMYTSSQISDISFFPFAHGALSSSADIQHAIFR